MAVLKTEDLTRYFGGLIALKNVNIEIRENEIVGIIGPNGAGKTTLTNVIAGVYLPTNGRIIFNGQDITELPTHRRCRLGIGRTFQLARPLGDMNLLENVMVGALFGQGLGQREARGRAREICEFLGIEEVERDVARLTALEIKKMEISHALATQPKMLFLDEVMAGLNADETMEMIELVRKINARGIAVVVIEHVMQVIRELTHRVVVLDWGEVIAEGPYEQVSTNSQVITAYLGEEE
jgi:branched-chain amino acid transport system ATP-binding protein